MSIPERGVRAAAATTILVAIAGLFSSAQIKGSALICVACGFGVLLLSSACLNFGVVLGLNPSDRRARFPRFRVAQTVLFLFSVGWWIFILIDGTGAVGLFLGLGVVGASVIAFATLVVDSEGSEKEVARSRSLRRRGIPPDAQDSDGTSGSSSP